MARPLRIEYEGAIYHVTSRGNAGEAIYLNDTDRDRFLELLGIVVEQFGWICHAYCLMTNHFHLLVETPAPNLSRGMKHLNGVYTQWFNRQHARVGHLVQGRFKAILVEKESYLLELARYIVLNPVRAQMVRSAREWRWSSYRSTARLASPPAFLATAWILSQFNDDPGVATHAYRAFVKRGRGIDVWEALKAGMLLGTDTFVESLNPLLKDVAGNREIRKRERLATRPSLEELFADASDKRARNAQIHASVRTHEYELKEVGDFLGLSSPTISVIAKHVEEAEKPKE